MSARETLYSYVTVAFEDGVPPVVHDHVTRMLDDYRVEVLRNFQMSDARELAARHPAEVLNEAADEFAKPKWLDLVNNALLRYGFFNPANSVPEAVKVRDAFVAELRRMAAAGQAPALLCACEPMEYGNGPDNTNCRVHGQAPAPERVNSVGDCPGFNPGDLCVNCGDARRWHRAAGQAPAPEPRRLDDDGRCHHCRRTPERCDATGCGGRRDPAPEPETALRERVMSDLKAKAARDWPGIGNFLNDIIDVVRGVEDRAVPAPQPEYRTPETCRTFRSPTECQRCPFGEPCPAPQPETAPDADGLRGGEQS